MSLASPWVWVLLGLAAPIVVAYFARRRAPKAIVGSTMLLRAAQGVASSRQAVARLKHPLSLLLVLCALVALLAGLAGPRCGEDTDGRLIIVADRSASMGRRIDGDRTLLDRARTAIARKLADTTADEIAVVLTGPDPLIAVGLTPDRTRVEATLAGLAPDGAGELVDAVELAETLCADPARDTILVVSDGGRLPQTRCPVEGVSLGQPGPNVGIAMLRGRVADGLGLVEALVAVTSDGGPERTVDVELFMDKRLVDSFAVEVPASGSAWTLRRVSGSGSQLQARLVGEGGSNGTDDYASVTLQQRPMVRVGLVTQQPQGFVATALRLHPGAVVDVVDPAGAITLGEQDLVVLEAPAVVPPQGRIVAFGDAVASVGFGAGAAIESPAVSRWSFDDPLFRYVDLDGVVIRSARPVEVPDGGESLLEAGGVPLVVRGKVSGRPAVAFGFGAADTDLVLRVGFVHLIANLVEAATPPVIGGPTVRRGSPGVSEVAVPTRDDLPDLPRATSPGVRGLPWWAVAVWVAIGLLVGEAVTGVLRPWRRVPQWRMGASWAVRLVVLMVLFASLLGLRITVPAGRPAVVFVVDRSASVDDAGLAEARQKVEFLRRQLPEAARVGLVMVDGDASVVVAPGREWAWPEPARQTLEERTDLGSGVQVGLGLIDPGAGGRLVLVTDGGDTAGRLAGARRAARALSVPVDVVLLTDRAADPAIVDVELDATVVRPGQTVGGTIVLRGPAGDVGATVTVSVDDEVLVERSVTLPDGQERLRFEQRLPDDLTVGPRRVDVRLEVDGPDLELGNNQRRVGLTVGAPARALVITNRAAELEGVVRALRAEDMQVFIEPPDQVSGEDLLLTDVVIIGDVPIKAAFPGEAALAPEFVQALRPWVSSGGGLITFGGDRSYELGGWGGTPLAAVLPLDLSSNAEDVEPAVTMVQILDKSASMGDWSGVHTKMALANEAAVASMRLLRAKDQLGVLAVNTDLSWVVPTQAASDPLRLSAAIRGIRPRGGGIYTYSSLVEAERAVARAETPIKHVVLYADAQDAEEKTKGTEIGYGTGPSSFSVAERLRRRGATLSVIALGDRRDQDVPFLERLAVIGGGRFRITREPKELRALFVEETKQVVRSIVHDGGFYVRVQGAHPMLTGLDLAKSPRLLGYVEVKPRPTADLLLLGPQDRPVLATWQYGLGHVVSWSTDLGGRWGRRWLDWPGYPRLVVQQTRWALRPPVARGAGVDVSPHHDGVRFTVTRLADDGLALPDGGLVGRLDGGPEPQGVALSPEQPGTWVGTARLPTGDARTLVVLDATTGNELARQDLVVPPSPERELLARNDVVELAAATDGALEPESVGKASEGSGRSQRLGWFLALLAVLLLPLDAWIRIPARG